MSDASRDSGAWAMVAASPNDTRVGIVGAGAMGTGIAQVAAAAGYYVLLGDAMAGAVRNAQATIRSSLDRLVEKGKLDAQKRGLILSRIDFYEEPLGVDVSPYRDCGLVIEAIREDLGAKQTLFAALSAAVAPTAVLATNTSSLSVASIASGCVPPERVVGLHFFNPAPVMPLVEVVPWLGTDPAITASMRALVESWSKSPVVAADTPGFIVNRVARPYYGEALRILDEGIADCATIDWAMKELGGFRMGPFELMDFIGHDVNHAVTRSMYESMYWEPRYKPSLSQKRLVDAGFLGRKSGRGFYRYDGSPMPEPVRDRALGTQVFERILAMLINEAADAVFYRVGTARDIDLAMQKGVNYPKGLLAWSDALGTSWAYDRLTALQAEYAEDRYRPSPLLRRMARAGRRFHE
ncbi:MAG TPA: 3-hydroxyacyl-CoA dehydrogenase NAD-binding domain-containing protein [Gemmatimonadaceae bacterium]|nr:3-hydroxyacyl-CoA dehydrogenase NAD-binding domain-containing protein [Gemmatimonadaceae bacterium]